MCYSEELKREAGGYHVDGEWVLTGWKGMHTVAGEEVWAYRRIEEVKSIQVMAKGTGFTWKTVELPPAVRYEAYKQKLGTKYVSSYNNAYVYEFGKVMTDDHGFHLAATKKGAKNAVSGGGSVYTKILAKESAIENNHAHVVMILEPSKNPTEDQIRAVALAKYDMANVEEDRELDYTTVQNVGLINTSQQLIYNPGSITWATSVPAAWAGAPFQYSSTIASP